MGFIQMCCAPLTTDSRSAAIKHTPAKIIVLSVPYVSSAFIFLWCQAHSAKAAEELKVICMYFKLLHLHVLQWEATSNLI